MIIRECLNHQVAMICVYLFIFSMALLSNKKRELQGPIFREKWGCQGKKKEKQGPFDKSVSKETILISTFHCILSIL